MVLRLAIVWAASLIIGSVSAQELVIKPVVGFQLWSTLSEGTSFIDPDTGSPVAVDSRLGFQLHRSRLGVKGSYGDRLNFTFIAASDFVGKDFLDGTIGGPNNTASPRFRLWNAHIDYDLDPKSDLLNLRVGYFLIPLSRESIVSPFNVLSSEKSWSQNYIRRQMTNNGPGRTAGISIGGYKAVKKNTFAFSYDIGVFNSRFGDFNTNSAGTQASHVVSGRVTLQFGEPESKSYLDGTKQISFVKRRGLTIGFSQAVQGSTDFYDSNNVSAVDWLLQWDHIIITGEWAVLGRSLDNISTSARTGFIRGGYMIPLQDEKFVSLALGHTFFNGTTDQSAVDFANSVRAFSGEDRYTEATFNYHMTKKSRFTLSYTWRSGSSGDVRSEQINNNYFQQSGFTFMRPSYFIVGWHFTI
jgi:hypothetical protein